MHSKSKKLWLDLKIAILCRRFLLDILCYLTSGRTQPAGRNFCWGITPAHLAATALQSAGMAHLAYVVEGHASACPQTVGVGTLCGVVQMTTEERHGKVVCMMIKVEDIKIKTIIIFEKKNVIRL